MGFWAGIIIGMFIGAIAMLLICGIFNNPRDDGQDSYELDIAQPSEGVTP